MSQKTKRVVSPAIIGLSIIIAVFAASLFAGGEHAFAATAETAEKAGFFQTYFVHPLTIALNTVAGWFGGTFGYSVIVMTLAIRLVLMPLMLKSTKSSMQMRDKMNKAQPEMKKIQDRMKTATTNEQKAKLQQELMEVYKKHDINPVASFGGCLPVLIQMPILMGFYYAIRNSPDIAEQSFLWFNLGSPDYILALMAAGVYFLQAKLSFIGMTEEQKKQMAMMAYISPIMMGMFSMTAPAALPLYWTVGGTFLILQTYISKKLYSSQPIAQEVSK